MQAVDRPAIKADLARMKTELERAESLFKEQLIAKQEFDLKKYAV